MCHNKKYKSINSGIILRLLFGAYCIALFLVLFVRKRFNIGDEPYWEQVKMSINLVPFRTIYGSVYIIGFLFLLQIQVGSQTTYMGHPLKHIVGFLQHSGFCY